jgi:outer membrane lipoprotein-sorting protein
MAEPTGRKTLCLLAALAVSGTMGFAAKADDNVFNELVAHNGVRNAALLEYAATRTYRVADIGGRVHAQEVGRMTYQAPDKKTFVVTSEDGSAVVRRLALTPLIASEISAAGGKDRHDSAITPENYTLRFLGEEQVGPYHCIVAQAIPRRADKYLFAGKVWIDARDYAVVRIEGHPAAKLSFWIKRADFVRQYQKIDGLWLPQRDETIVEIRFYGKKVLTIDHRDYVVKSKLPAIGNSW